MTFMADSRFHMWRAVFALAHADGQVSDKERQFMQIYLSRLTVSPEQKDILKADIENSQEVSLMFSKITQEKDVEDFFNFARLLVWCDGDFAEQERQILELLRQRHDTPLGTERMLYKLKSSGEKKSSWLRAMRAKVWGLKDVLDIFASDAIIDDAKGKKGEGLERSQFYMWRAVFAMAHADNVVTEEEKKYLNNILAKEAFSAEQRNILIKDMDQPQDIAEMFVNIEDQNDRSQFFYHARMLVWSDGDFGEQEQKIMMRLKQTHVRTVDFDQVMKNLNLTIDDDQRQRLIEDRNRVIESDPPHGFFRRLLRSVSGR